MSLGQIIPDSVSLFLSCHLSSSSHDDASGHTHRPTPPLEPPLSFASPIATPTISRPVCLHSTTTAAAATATTAVTSPSLTGRRSRAYGATFPHYLSTRQRRQRKVKPRPPPPTFCLLSSVTRANTAKYTNFPLEQKLGFGWKHVASRLNETFPLQTPRLLPALTFSSGGRASTCHRRQRRHQLQLQRQ